MSLMRGEPGAHLTPTHLNVEAASEHFLMAYIYSYEKGIVIAELKLRITGENQVSSVPLPARANAPDTRSPDVLVIAEINRMPEGPRE